MKKIFFILSAVLLSTGALFAETVSNIKIGDIYYELHKNDQMWIDNHYVDTTYAFVTANPNKYAGKVEIPGQVEYEEVTYPVASIGGSAFRDCSNLTSVTILEGVTSIGYSAFRNCSSLSSVDLPSTLTSIENAAFWACTSLYSVVLPDAVTNLGTNCFWECSNLHSITMPRSLTSIGSDAFYCNNLREVHISDLAAWCKVSFQNDNSNPLAYAHHLYLGDEELTDITIPDGITSLRGTFYGCSGLKSVTLPEGVTTIDWSAFRGTGLTSINIPNTVTNIGDAAFYACTSLSSVTIPEGVTSIAGNAFYNCYSLTSVVLPNTLENIANNVFDNCTKLASVTFGKNLANIHVTAFNGCSNLSSIVWNVKDFTDFGNATLSPFYSLRSKIKSFTFGADVEHIPAYLCYQMSNLGKIDIPANVTSVGEGAFAYCGRLTEINAAEGSPLYTSVDGVLFNKDQTTLIIYPAGKASASYTVPNTVTRIEDNAFYGCSNLSSVEVPASVTEIGKGNSAIPMWSFAGTSPAAIPDENAFASNVYLLVDDVEAYKAAWPDYASRIFPKQYAVQALDLVAKADKSALHMAIGDANLENVIKLTIKGTINSYDLMIMRNKMINLRELDLTDANIEANPYEYYTGFCSHADTLLEHSFRYIVSLKLPKTLKYCTNAVQDCGNLKYLEINGGVVGPYMAASSGLEVVLNEGVTEIQADAFAGTGIKKIAINCPITQIYANSFQQCLGLQDVQLPATLETIGENAFRGTSLVSITLPANLRIIGNHAFAPSAENSWTFNYRGYYYSYTSNGMRSDEYRYTYSLPLSQVRFDSEAKLQRIGSFAFFACQIDSLFVPDSVNYIGQFAFCRNTNLRCVSFSDESKLTSIGQGVFQLCNSLDSLRLPASLKSIGGMAFSIHEDLEDAELKLLLPEALETIEAGAFYGRKHMSKVAFPNTLKSIAREAFRKCEGLPNLSFPTSLQTIGDYAFEGCKGLEEIKVPSTLLSVGDYAFSDCSDVTKVYTYTVEPVSINQNTFSCWKSADLYVPTTSYYTYYYNTQWSQFLSLKQFDEEYEYFYINNDYELGGDNGTIDGNPDADLNENSGLIVTGDEEQGMGTITIMGDGVNAGSVIACEENLNADSLAIRIVTHKGNWNYFCFPFDLLLDQFHFAHQYVIREYSGGIRAQYGAGGWIDMIGDMVHRGLGYIFQGAETDTLVITIKNPKISCEDFQQTVLAHASDDNIHSNWNFIGNPYPSWYDLDALFNWGFNSAIYIWNGIDYQVYMPGDDEYHFHPYEGFFTQNPKEEDIVITWGSDGRETKTQAEDKQNGHHMPRKAVRAMRQASQQRKLINIQLASETYSDQTRVVFNDAARLSYELGRDAVKMDGGNGDLHIWSFAEGNRLSINERPYADGQISLGYDVNADGFYTLSATRMDTAVIIYDNELKQEVDLSLGDYHFFTVAGTNNTRFSIIRIKSDDKTATGIENAEFSTPNSDIRKELIDGQLFIIHDGKMYDVQGKQVK